MSLIILRGIGRKCYTLEQTFVLSKLYSTRGSPDGKQSAPTTDKTTPKIESDANNLDVKKSALARREQVQEDIRGYVFTRYIDYVQNYEKVLEKRFPAAMRVYRVFMDGVKEFFKDMKALLKIKKIITLSPKGLDALTRRELELNYQMPRDMWKVAPVLLLSAIPFGHYVVFPLAYMYPRLFLTSHFWTLQQRNEFAITILKNRLEYNRCVFRLLQAKLKQMKNDNLYEKWQSLLGQLGSGLHPTSQDILVIRDLFERAPYNTRSLGSTHVKYLCGLHGIHRGPFKRSRLTYRTMCINLMDRAIIREGGVHNMPADALRNSCFMRGLNAANMSSEDLVEWLQAWVDVSSEVNGDNFSLLLHLPILLGYNHPNNWHLVYKEREKKAQ